MRPCTRCKGNKVVPDLLDDSKTRPCNSCGGVGEYPEVDQTDILKRITASQGKNKGKIRASMTSPFRSDGHVEARAYYVWRLARFHGGKDMTMPVMADLVLRGDPYKPELDKLADEVAKTQFGSDMAAAFRWGRALGVLP